MNRGLNYKKEPPIEHGGAGNKYKGPEVSGRNSWQGSRRTVSSGRAGRWGDGQAGARS